MDRSYGWVVVAAGIAITCVGMGSVMALSVFLPPLEAAQGWSRTAVAGASMLSFLAVAWNPVTWPVLLAAGALWALPECYKATVSYTHLTLPTNREV